MRLDGRVVVVTGAFGALGRALCAQLTRDGAKTAAVDHAPAPDAFEAAFVRGGVDLADPAQARSAIEAASDALGPLWGLANVAGGFVWQTLEDGDLGVWERMFALNLKTAASACKAALPRFYENGGRIVNVGANGAVRAAAGMGAYAASKAGVAKLTESLAEELKGRRITVNAVLPSILDTPANRADMPDADPSAWVTPQSAAEVIAFLLSDAARDVTGAQLPVAGRV
jgi:NAD(P)-dependent dehydrogenase (short-subunit alcohol dehydrogenase family)